MKIIQFEPSVPPPDSVVTPIDELFRGFADPTRLRILNLLAAGDLCVGDVVDILRLSQPAVSRHLAYLRRTGLVEANRHRKFVRYRLAEAHHPVHRNLIECVRSCFRGMGTLEQERDMAEHRVAAMTATSQFGPQ